ncbi:acyloxyacyl hydrolase [Alcaligenaceae bacterium]|nr:acyloxyacyl hydrolase [Alcaligenaceae bacterium]
MKKTPIICAQLAVAVLAVGCVSSTWAETSSVSLRAGLNNNYQRYELAWVSPSLWTHRFSGNWGRLDLVGEMGAAYWHADGARSPSSVWQLNAIPMLRWTLQDRFYLEVGSGPTIFSRTRFADKALSTALQFGSHVGAGVMLSSASSLGVRLSHFSNANIKKPNPGLQVIQMQYTYRY